MKALEFTGERYVPGQGGSQIAYEHWHRYLYALRWARGKDVVDVAAGTGYGARLLSSVARHVWALDRDPETVAYARREFEAPNLLFIRTDVLRLPLPPHSVDLVVAFEILEHLADAEQLVREAGRVVRPGGVVLISTPNKAEYSDARGYTNAFHAREFYQDEFSEFLRPYFRHVKIVHQRMRAGSMISAEPCAAGESHEVFTSALPACRRESLAGMYFLAICGNGEAVSDGPSISAYLDLTDMLFQETDLRLNQSMAGFSKLKRKASALAGDKEVLEGQVEELKALILSREQELVQIRERFREELNERERTIQSLRCQLAKALDGNKNSNTIQN